MKLYLCLGFSFSKEVQRRSAFIGGEQMIRWGSSFFDWCIWCLWAASSWCVFTLPLQHSTRIPETAIVSMCSLYINRRSECLRVPRAIVVETSNLLPRSRPGQLVGSCSGSLTCLKLSSFHGTVRCKVMVFYSSSLFEWSLLWPYKLWHQIAFKFFVTAITAHHCPSL